MLVIAKASLEVTDSKNFGRTTSVPKSALHYEMDKIPRSGNLLYSSLVLPELKKVRREFNVY